MKILLATDSSASSEAVTSEVARRPWPQGTEVCVLSVVGLRDLATWDVADAVAEAEGEDARALAQSAADRLSSRGIDTTAAVIKGHPRARITEYAESWGADFIFVGSHGHCRPSRFLLGSTAKAVLRHAHCSVGIARTHPSGNEATINSGMKIMLAVDGSDYAMSAARSLAERPWPAGSEVKIVSAVQPYEPPEGPFYPEPSTIRRVNALLTKLSRKAVRDARQVIRGSGLQASTSVLVGSPKTCLLEGAENWCADLILVGSHGLSGMVRLLMGSVSEAVAIHAHCSVEIIRRRT